MKIVDMSHVMNVHTPGWVGYAGNKMYYAQNLQTQMIVAQRIDTALHVGTHFDGAMHATDDPKGDMASLPLDYLVNRGVVVDISAKMSDWAVITPEIIESAGADIREGDILILHTGWHRHYEGQPQQDLVKYFCFHPGPNLDTMHWMLKKKIKWWAMDTGSCDHAMNTSIRNMRPDLAAQFTKLKGKTPAEFFGTFEYTHKKSGRKVVADMFPFHNWAFQEGLLHAENLGGDIELMLNKRALIGAFPWRYEGLEGCPCRIVAFLDAAAAEIAKETNRKVVPIVADLTKDADARNFVAQGHKALGRVDIMVNNAGSAPGGVIEHLSEADWEKGLQLKFMGYVRCLRYVLPIMVKQGGGRVVNLIGNDGVKPSYWEIVPGAANAAGQNLTKSLAGQYGKHNISFVAVNPGPVRTERWAGLVAAMSRDMKLPYEQADKLAPAAIPLGRIAEVDECGNLVAMLASPLMHMVNGTMIEIDGGQEKALMDRMRDRK